MHRGWFAVHRKIFESDVWQHPTAFFVWIYILGSVTHEVVTLAESYQAVTLQPAQMLTSVARIAAKCRLSTRSVRTALTYLISTNRVTIETTSRFSIITVTNWPAYREAMFGNDKQNDKPNDNQATSRRQTDDNIQEDLKKIEKRKKDLPPASAPSGGAADHTDDEPDNSPEARAERKRQIEEAKKIAGLIGQPPGAKDRGNGHDKSVGEGKVPKEQPLTPGQQRAFGEIQAAVLRGDKTPADAALELHLQHGFTEEQADLVEKVMTP